MTNNEHFNDIADLIMRSIRYVAVAEGQIDCVVKMGNSIIIKFHNGTTYRQELISKQDPSIVIED